MADDPAVALMLLGMGYDSVSVAPTFLPEIKFAVRRTSLADARALAADVVAQSTVDGVKRALSKMRDRLHA
jgi:phosphotransferase system enzyme I (PtsP)